MNDNKKLFAFKLAEKKQTEVKSNQAQFKARDGVAAAGCSASGRFGLLRYNAGDNGMYC